MCDTFRYPWEESEAKVKDWEMEDYNNCLVYFSLFLSIFCLCRPFRIVLGMSGFESRELVVTSRCATNIATHPYA